MSENLSILIAQTNPKVGDIQANKNHILKAISEFSDCDLIVFFRVNVDWISSRRSRAKICISKRS